MQAVGRLAEAPMPGARAWRDLPVEILPHLLLGDRRCAHETIVEAYGVTHVLNMAGRAARSKLPSVRYLEIEADDDENYPILPRHR